MVGGKLKIIQNTKVRKEHSCWRTEVSSWPKVKYSQTEETTVNMTSHRHDWWCQPKCASQRHSHWQTNKKSKDKKNKTGIDGEFFCKKQFVY
jgi:hypothetical protein